MYKLLRQLLFLLPPEQAHQLSMFFLRLACSTSPSRRLIRKFFDPGSQQPIQIGGLLFKNRVGLAAGFDKNAIHLRELSCLGFGHVEIGTVTPQPQRGNERPRLFRLPQDKALINRMGFNNDGVVTIARRLKEWREQGQKKSDGQPPLIIGGNIGKNKVTSNEEAWRDYEFCFERLHPWVDYFVVNVSSPNTPGLRALQEKESLKKILTLLQQRNNEKKIQRPLLLKIAPDLSSAQVDDVIALALEIKLDGLVVSNTTIERSGLSTEANRVSRIGAGGLSGAPLREKNTELLRYITERTRGSIPLIASGGIFTAADALEKTKAGATLVQVWTGFIYEGPVIARNIGKAF
ncbi:MAG: quinone-dependent dihydroorotate dehydrogenase [Sphingomonadales bacterium]|nr:quinone-dependent dihydroorotate dehydrogenase [Sphingomonadales bacterium]